MLHLAMFVKYWQAGQVKTRLAAGIGADVAAEVYAVFVRHIMRSFEHFGDRRTIVYSPDEAVDAIRQAVNENWDLQPQGRGDLGTRMRAFFERNASPNMKTILIGSDTPDLPIPFVERAAAMLVDTRVVLGPATDGGYYLVGMSGPPVDAFSEIQFSTDTVLQATRERLDRMGIEYALLPPLTDIDETDDLQQLIARLSLARDDRAADSLWNDLMRLRLGEV